MADNVDITAGTGTTIATDDSGTGHVQIVKLAQSADGSRTPIDADGSGLKVQLGAALPAGTAAIGKLAANDGVDVGDVTINNGSAGAAVNIQDGGNSITVDNGGTFATQLTTATATGDTTMQNAVAATGNGTNLTVTGYGNAICSITGTFTATITFEGSIDAGATWTAVSASMMGTTQIATTATAPGQYRLNVTGLDLLRARVTWTSGTSVTVVGRATNAASGERLVSISTNSIAKAEDAASADADIGVPALAVRKATPANTSGTDGDYEFLQMSAGRLWASATIDAALPAGTNAIGKLAANDAVDIGDVTINNASGASAVNIQDGGNSITVDGTVAVSNAILGAAGAGSVAKAEDSASADADVGIPAMAIRKATPANTSSLDGDYEMLQMSAGRLWASATIDAALPAGSNSIGTTVPNGNVAHDSVDSTNPIKIGAKAETSPAGITAVADGDRTDLYADADGLLMTKPFTAYGDILVERLSDTGGTSTASTVFGATASARNYITTIAVYNASATAGYVDFRDGTAGTVLFTLPLPAGGGSVVSFPLPLRQTTVNTAFAYDVSAALTTVYISLIGFKSKV